MAGRIAGRSYSARAVVRPLLGVRCSVSNATGRSCTRRHMHPHRGACYPLAPSVLAFLRCRGVSTSLGFRARADSPPARCERNSPVLGQSPPDRGPTSMLTPGRRQVNGAEMAVGARARTLGKYWTGTRTFISLPPASSWPTLPISRRPLGTRPSGWSAVDVKRWSLASIRRGSHGHRTRAR
jgi:hypothetical protein